MTVNLQVTLGDRPFCTTSQKCLSMEISKDQKHKVQRCAYGQNETLGVSLLKATLHLGDTLASAGHSMRQHI